MERHLRSGAIMIEVTTRHKECTHSISDYSPMLAVALHNGKAPGNLKFCRV